MLDEASLRLKADAGNDSIVIATDIEDVLILVDIYRVEGISEILEVRLRADLLAFRCFIEHSLKLRSRVLDEFVVQVHVHGNVGIRFP